MACLVPSLNLVPRSTPHASAYVVSYMRSGHETNVCHAMPRAMRLVRLDVFQCYRVLLIVSTVRGTLHVAGQERGVIILRGREVTLYRVHHSMIHCIWRLDITTLVTDWSMVTSWPPVPCMVIIQCSKGICHRYGSELCTHPEPLLAEMHPTSLPLNLQTKDQSLFCVCS